MSATDTNTLIRDDELQAALAEIEQLSSTDADKIPDLDDGGEEAGSPSAGEDTAPKPPVEAATVASSAREADSSAEATAEQEAGAEELTPAPAMSWATRCHTVTDRALERLSRPLERFSPTVRNAVGWVSAATILAAVLAALFIPILAPRRDAITLLRERVAQLESSPAPVDPEPP